MTAIRIATNYARAVLHATGAQLGELQLRLVDGRWVAPLAKPPWQPDVLSPDTPPHMRRLGSEFFCLPFGGGGTLRDPTPGWEGLLETPSNPPMHGPAANADWTLAAHDETSATFTLVLHGPSAVAHLRRTIARACSRGPKGEFSFVVMEATGLSRELTFGGAGHLTSTPPLTLHPRPPDGADAPV